MCAAVIVARSTSLLTFARELEEGAAHGYCVGCEVLLVVDVVIIHPRLILD